MWHGATASEAQVYVSFGNILVILNYAKGRDKRESETPLVGYALVRSAVSTCESGEGSTSFFFFFWLLD